MITPIMFFFLNEPAETLAMYDILGLTFENAEQVFGDLCDPTVLFAPLYVHASKRNTHI